MAGLFEGYRVDGAWDEVSTADGQPHEHVRPPHASLAALSGSHSLGVVVEVTRLA